MWIRFSVVDLSALDRRQLAFIVAMRDIHRLLDRDWELRQLLGASLKPPAAALLPLGDNIYAVVARA